MAVFPGFLSREALRALDFSELLIWHIEADRVQRARAEAMGG